MSMTRSAARAAAFREHRDLVGKANRDLAERIKNANLAWTRDVEVAERVLQGRLVRALHFPEEETKEAATNG